MPPQISRITGQPILTSMLHYCILTAFSWNFGIKAGNIHIHQKKLVLFYTKNHDFL